MKNHIKIHLKELMLYAINVYAIIIVRLIHCHHTVMVSGTGHGLNSISINSGEAVSIVTTITKGLTCLSYCLFIIICNYLKNKVIKYQIYQH